MSHHITVLPASTKAGRETIRALLASDSKPSVRAVYRDPSKAPAEFIKNSNFEAVNGDVGDGNSLNFTGSNAVFYIPPPTYDGTDQGEWATRAANNVKKALEAANVKRLVILSAIGAQNSSGIVRTRKNISTLTMNKTNRLQGVLRLNHISDEFLKDSVPEVVIIRPTYFFEDFAHLLDAAKDENPTVHSWITPIDYKIPLVSDIQPFKVDRKSSTDLQLPGWTQGRSFKLRKPSPHLNCQAQPVLPKCIRSSSVRLCRSQRNS